MILVFISGLAVMVIEMSFSRMMAPYFGASLVTWTNLIAVVMLGLSLGYAWGGRRADQPHPEQALELSLLMAAFWTLALPFVAPFMIRALTLVPFPLQWWVSIGSFLSLMLAVFPVMVLLGMTPPLALRLRTERLSELGQRSGSVSMVSTWGSFVGTFLPAFLLLPYLGVAHSMILMGCALGILTAVYFRRTFVAVLIGVLLLFAWLLPSSSESHILEHRESAYGAMWVKTLSDGSTALYVDTPFGIQSVHNPDTALNSLYYAYIGILPPRMSSPHSALILGHAGGSFTRVLNAYYPDLQVTGVEIDPAVTEMARKHMDLNSLNVDLHHDDARAFLLKDSETYDLIVVDTYHAASLPAHLATREFFELALEHLNPDGLLVLNAAATEGPFLESLSATLADLNRPLHTFKVPGSYNTFLVSGVLNEAKNTPQELQDLADLFDEGLQSWSGEGTVFTDDTMNRVETLSAAMWWHLLQE